MSRFRPSTRMACRAAHTASSISWFCPSTIRCARAISPRTTQCALTGIVQTGQAEQLLESGLGQLDAPADWRRLRLRLPPNRA